MFFPIGKSGPAGSGYRRGVAVHGVTAVADSTITLTGTVSSWAERSQAEHAAWSTPGAVYVHNELTVTPDESWNTAETSATRPA